MRIHLFEFEDLKWFPSVIRESMTDFLTHFLDTTGYYDAIVPLLQDHLLKTRTLRIVDLCSGGGGPVMRVQEKLRRQYDNDIRVVLTDLYPNVEAYKLIEQRTIGRITFSGQSVNALDIPPQLEGCFTLFSAFHHFRPAYASELLAQAARKNQSIAIFDGGDKGLPIILAIILVQPVLFLLFTPFFKPFRFSRLLFTYIIPLIPLCTIWDGVVSMLRLYRTRDLKKMIQAIDTPGYEWQIGRIKTKMGMHITYLLGRPV
jgi:hypothetical protein